MLAVDSLVIVAFAVGILAIAIILKLLKLPIKLLMKFISNSVVGVLILCIVNLFGVGLKVTIINAFLVGVFGIPGVIALIIWEKFL